VAGGQPPGSWREGRGQGEEARALNADDGHHLAHRREVVSHTRTCHRGRPALSGGCET
jgi:hypothetical protein